MKRVKTHINIEDFHDKPEVKEAISNSSTNPTPHNIQQGSRFLIYCLIIDGGASRHSKHKIDRGGYGGASKLEGKQTFILGYTST
jgi:hypothetical protein